MTGPARYAEVVLPVPVSRAYTYQIPDALADRVHPGARVIVPVRRRRAVGVVTAVDVAPPAAVAKPLAGAPDAEPALSSALLDLGRWISDYYGAPLGLALRAILPGPLWSVARPEGPAEAGERVLVLTERVESLLERERVWKRAPPTKPSRRWAAPPRSRTSPGGSSSRRACSTGWCARASPAWTG